MVQILSCQGESPTHSKGYVENLSIKRGRKRCTKMAVLP
nr:secretion protein HlyD [Selenomonas felix]